MERELDKIERRFKVYSREQEKDIPLETETGSGLESEKTSFTQSGEGEANNHDKKRYMYIGCIVHSYLLTEVVFLRVELHVCTLSTLRCHTCWINIILCATDQMKSRVILEKSQK